MGHILIQVILNVAVVTNTIPNTGITLPTHQLWRNISRIFYAGDRNCTQCFAGLEKGTLTGV